MTRISSLFLLTLSAVCAAGCATKAVEDDRPAGTFAEMPVVTSEGTDVRIKFALTQPLDVEVAVVDASGRVVRHLAAGMVGRSKAAPPLVGGALRQSILWDRRDDLGRPAVNGKYKVRVRMGMQVAFGRNIGDNPYVIENPRSIATDRAGNVHLMSQSYRSGDGKSAGPKYIQVFDRSGKYLRTTMPYSSSLSRDRLKRFGLIETGGPVTPRNYEGVWPSIYPIPGLLMAPDVGLSGELMFSNGDRLFMTDRTGAAMFNFKGLPLWPKDKPRFNRNRLGLFAAAKAPGATRIYVAGMYVDSKKADAKMKAAWPKGRIYVYEFMTFFSERAAKPFLDIPITRDRDLELPAAMKRMRRGAHGPIHGLAVDVRGNLYVCDRANDRIAVFSGKAKLIAEIPVRQPHLVEVHPNGEIVVVTMRPMGYRLFDTRLMMFKDMQAKAPLAEMKLPDTAGRPLMAMDRSEKWTAVWLTAVKGSEVWRIERRGDKLVLARKLPVKAGGDMWGADRIAVDYETDDIYINDGWSSLARYNGVTGEGGVVADARALTGVWERDTNQRKNLSVTDATVGPNGIVYLRNGPRYSGPITRWGRGLKPMPVNATGSHVFAKYIYSRFGAGYGERGMAVHPDGRVYVVSMYKWAKYFVHVFGPDGTPLNQGRLDGQATSYAGHGITSGLIGPLTGHCGGIKVDVEGNVYLGMLLTPDGFKRPKGFEADRAYGGLVGSVFKFKPTGGGLGSSKGKATGPDGVKIGRTFVEGATAVYPDFGVFSGKFGSQCACRSPRFDLDPFGRLYIPNAVRYSVGVVDNVGNPILRFGQYGNRDEEGKGAVVPLGWPLGVGISKKHIYVSDMLNKRIVRADVRYGAVITADVPKGGDVHVAKGLDIEIAQLASKYAWAEARVARSLRRRGPAALAALKKAFAKPKASRRAIRDVVAWIQMDQAMRLFAPTPETARDVAPLIERAQRLLTQQKTLPTLRDALVNLAHMTRLSPKLPLGPGVKRCFADSAPNVRLAALWAVDRLDRPADEALAIEIASQGLQDKDERIRTLAAVLLFDHGHADGLAHIFAGAMTGKQQWVLDQARPYVQESVVMAKGPLALRYPVSAAQVDQVLKLLGDPHNNMRAMAAAVLMFSGEKRAAKALAARLAEEKIGFVRRRIMLALEKIKSRDATVALLADVANGPGIRKKGTGWRAAECLADTGDPEAVAPLIAMLDQPKSKALALFALGHAFDESIITAGEFRLIPDKAGALAKHSIHKLPPDAQVKAAWTAFWKANRAKYKWTGKRHPLRQ
jgi:HEAT repeat protein